MKEKQLILKSSVYNGDKPGIDKTKIILQFENFEKGDLGVGSRITADYGCGQNLIVNSIDENLISCELVTLDKKEWFNGMHLLPNTVFYKLTYPSYNENK